jgi:hypothetical protein
MAGPPPLPLIPYPSWLGQSLGQGGVPAGSQATPAPPTGPAATGPAATPDPGAPAAVAPPVAGGEYFMYRQGSATDTNNQRTSARSGPAPYADAGVTSSGDSVFAGAAAIKGRDPNTGIEAEIFTISGQVGAQNEVQVGMARVGASSDDGRQSIGMDVFTARAMVGIHNPDGSVGLNAGAMATAIGVEGTANYSGNSITGGLSLSAGAEGHIGIRDSDGDGSSELSVRVSVMFFTIGFAIENPF